MIQQYFGVKELNEVVLRAKTPMQFGSRHVEQDEPVLYFENISMSMMTEKNHAIPARGGWGNMPRVIWDDRSEVQFNMIEGVLSQVSLGILLSAHVLEGGKDAPLYVNKREGPKYINSDHRLYLQHWPVDSKIKKTFIFNYMYDAIQKKIYGKRIFGEHNDPFDPEKETPCLELYEDKELKTLADINSQYVVDYYYEYKDEALVYRVEKERFNGLFTLEGKFYSKDENEGNNYINLIYMPKVRIVSDISLRMGERADPTVSAFNIIGLPENVGDARNLIVEITTLGKVEDEEDME